MASYNNVKEQNIKNANYFKIFILVTRLKSFFR